MTFSNGFAATERSSYRVWTRESLRYADLDPVGHVNNTAYSVYIENARTMLFHRVMQQDGAGDDCAGLDWILRRIELDFLREILYPGQVDVGLAITRMGNSSMTLAIGVFTPDYCAATSWGVSVCFDTVARTSAPHPRPAAARAVGERRMPRGPGQLTGVISLRPSSHALRLSWSTMPIAMRVWCVALAMWGVSVRFPVMSRSARGMRGSSG